MKRQTSNLSNGYRIFFSGGTFQVKENPCVGFFWPCPMDQLIPLKQLYLWVQFINTYRWCPPFVKTKMSLKTHHFKMVSDINPNPNFESATKIATLLTVVMGLFNQ